MSNSSEGEPCHFKTLRDNSQEHLVKYWAQLSEDQRASLDAQISTFLPLEKLLGDYKKAFENAKGFEDLATKMHQIDHQFYSSSGELSPENAEKYWNAGVEAIANSHVGVLLLAGGQGTRLGVSYPKGMYDVGLPSKKTLYQLQAERILRLQSLAKKSFPDKNPKIFWYIMASEATGEQTKNFFENNSFFGLSSDQVVFFEQGLMPCFTFDGKIILDAIDRIAVSPDGNGGLYKALVKSRCLDDMVERNLKYMHVYCVDNILVRVADPSFIGYCIVKDADCGAKVVEKKQPDEAVGVICNIDDVGVRVVEYSEIPKKLSEEVDSHGKLLYRAGNIANHFFTVQFLQRVCTEHQDDLIYHIAKKKIPFIDANGCLARPKEPNGIKLEKFVFDVFQFSQRFYVWEVVREEEFSPLKNAVGSDSPATCREDIYRLHRRWVESAGNGNGITFVERKDESGDESNNSEDLEGKIPPPPTPVECEISPLISYRGEELEELLKRKGKVEFPIYLD